MTRAGWRTRAVVFAGCLVGILAMAGPSQADPLDEDTAVLWRNQASTSFDSPQHFALEVRVGQYPPNIDDEFGGTGPYKQVFGSKKRWMGGLEFDYQVLRIPYVGTLGPGLSWGYTTMSADTTISGTTEKSEEKTSLWIMPMSLAAVLRVDVLAEELRVPLVPTFKLGFACALWSTSNGSGTSRYETGDTSILGRGTSYGWNLGLGLALRLDPIDRHAARQLDNSVGINHSYLFVEWAHSKLDGFGSGDMLRVGTSSWVAGLAFEF